MKKRILSLLLAICLVAGLLPTVALAGETGYTVLVGDRGNNQNSDEKPDMLVDGNIDTKWCVTNFNALYGSENPCSIIFKTPVAMEVTGYSITTGNDNEAWKQRNPKSWTLYGSNGEEAPGRNSDSWQVIHSVINDTVLQDQNSTKYDYQVPEQNVDTYQYFKLEITATKGADVMQMGEFTLTSCAHNWVAGAPVLATCETKGYTPYTCSECHNTKIEDEVEPLGHAFGADGTCTNSGCGKNKDVLYTFDVAQNSVTIMNDDYPGKIQVQYGNEYVKYIDASQTITVTGSSTKNELYVNTAIPVTIKAKDLNINKSKAPYANAMSINTDGAKVTLILENKNVICGGFQRAGISVGVGKTLIIQGTGSLMATGGECGAGIGGNDGDAAGIITINSGTVTAIGGSGAAGIGAGYGKTNHGTFQTASNGTAVIFASSIGDQSQKASWSGIIFEGNEGQVYGTPTLMADLTIPEGKTLTIPEGKTLTIPEGKTLTIPADATLTNSGAIYVDGTLTGQVTDTDTGAVYYPLTLNYCTANEENTSVVGTTTYGKAGSTIALTTVAPAPGLEFKSWVVSPDTAAIVTDNSFVMPSEALAVTAQFNYAEVATEQELRAAINSGATYIKLMDDITIIGTLEWQDKEITLDLNGHVLESGNSLWVIILTDGDSTDNTSLTLIDSNPDQPNTVGGKQYKGGVIYGGITVTATGYGKNNCRLYANGGSVTNNVALHSLSSSIHCTSDTPTAFYGDAGRIGYIYGGMFYGNQNLNNIKGNIVTFKYNNNTYAREVVESGKTAVAPIPPKEPGADGYHIRWYLEGAEFPYDFSTSVTENITLNAKWENTYILAYDTGCDTEIPTTMPAYQEAVTLPEALVKTGYTFSGWSDGTATYQAGETYTMPAEDVTLTAQWTVNQYTITFDTDGGSRIAPITQDYGTDVTAPANPTKTGYTFAGWDQTIPNTMPANNMTIKAKWTVNQYTITYDLDGGTVEGNPDSYTVETDTFTLINPTKWGYIFTGWSGTGLTGENNLIVTIETGSTGNRNYTAHWRCNVSYIPTCPITVESAMHGDVTSSHKSAAKGDIVTLTVIPDKGYTLETITVTDGSGDEIELTNKGDGKYTFKMPGSKVTVTATFMEDNSMLNFFVDVFPGDYYHDAVLWAAENGITGGVDAAHFAPNGICTRAQAVTFLWRAAGCPAPKSSEMPFKDVVKGSYYYDAVLWAVENGITKGTSDTTFSPDATCTRGQIVTFLWRAHQSPDAGSANPFADVAADAYYADAVLWAVENGVTAGTNAEGTAFSPDDDCTRAQIVTFLFRCLGDE